MTYFEFVATLAALGFGIIILVLLFWARFNEKLAAQRKHIKSLIRRPTRTKGEQVTFDDMIPEDDLWVVTGNHPQLGRPDKGGLNDDEAREYGRELKRLGYEDILFIKQN